MDACKLKMGMLPLQCDAESLRVQVAEGTDREQNILADEPGVKRRRILAKLPPAEGVRRTRDHHRGGSSEGEVHTSAAPESHSLRKGHGYSAADVAATKGSGHGLQAATCPTEREERDDEEERELHADLHRAPDRLKKTLEDEDYTGAASVLENIAAL